MVKIFKFMRKHGFRTVYWDGSTCFCSKAQTMQFDGTRWSMRDDILEHLEESFGEAERWFHV